MALSKERVLAIRMLTKRDGWMWQVRDKHEDIIFPPPAIIVLACADPVGFSHIVTLLLQFSTSLLKSDHEFHQQTQGSGEQDHRGIQADRAGGIKLSG